MERALRYLESLELKCPCCGGGKISYGSYERHVRIVDTIEYIPIQRVKCNGCNKTHVECVVKIESKTDRTL